MFGFDWNSQSHKFGCFSVIYLFFLFLWIIFIYFKSPDTTFIQVTVHHFFSLIFNPNLNYSDIPPPVFFFFFALLFFSLSVRKATRTFQRNSSCKFVCFCPHWFFYFHFFVAIIFFFFFWTHTFITTFYLTCKTKKLLKKVYEAKHKQFFA